MGEFQSNLHTATQLATKMRNASDRMKSATSRSINKARVLHYLRTSRHKKQINKIYRSRNNFVLLFNKQLIISIP